MDATDLIGSYLAAVDFLGETPTYTIADAKLVLMPDEKTKRDKDKGCVFFRETPKGWVLNRTNLTLLIALLGKDTEAWKGKRVTLHAVMVKFGSEDKLGIRLKGAPGLAKPFPVSVKLPKRAAQEYVLVPTGKGATTVPLETTPAEPQGEPDEPGSRG